MYGRTNSSTKGELYLELDGQPEVMGLNGTTFSDGVAEIYRAENMEYGDHQLMANVPCLTNGTFLLDHFECGCPCSTPSQKECMLIISLFPGLKIRLEAASTLSVPDQLRRMYPRRRSLWTILTRRLYTITNPSGRNIPMVVMTTEAVRRLRLLLVLR